MRGQHHGKPGICRPARWERILLAPERESDTEPLPTGCVRGTKAGSFGVCVKTPYDEAFDPGWNPLTRPASADEDALAGHPLPQGGEGEASHDWWRDANSYLSACGALPAATIWCPCRARRMGVRGGPIPAYSLSRDEAGCGGQRIGSPRPGHSRRASQAQSPGKD
jgi:hypothetical protein